MLEVPEYICFIDPGTPPFLLQRAVLMSPPAGRTCVSGAALLTRDGGGGRSKHREQSGICSATKGFFFSNKIDQSECRCRERTPL